MIIAFSMYSKIPMPKTEWKDENLRYSFVFFPFVGLLIGGVIYGVSYLAQLLQLNTVFFGAICIFLNIIITGGIHIDGFCDVTDALGSHKDKEEKLRIMKDPNVGAFAVIYTALLLIVQLGAYSQMLASPKYISAVILIFAISRMLSGLSIVLFPCAKSSGLAAVFAKGASKTPVIIALIIMLLISFSLLIMAHMLFGLIVLIASILIFIWYYFLVKRQFGGITGDLAGYFLNIFEASMLVIIAVMGVIL